MLEIEFTCLTTFLFMSCGDRKAADSQQGRMGDWDQVPHFSSVQRWCFACARIAPCSEDRHGTRDLEVDVPDFGICALRVDQYFMARGFGVAEEHRRQDGWSDSGGCGEMAGERLPKQRPHLIEGTKDEEEACLTTAKKEEEPPDRNAAENLGARLPHLDEEAGSIVFHSAATRAK